MRNSGKKEFRGLSERTVRAISARKGEPDWLLDKRLKALGAFKKMPLPKWAADLSGLDLNAIAYYREAVAENSGDWKKVPKGVRRTFDRLGIPEAERKYFAGAGAQMESTAAYHNLKERWAEMGVIFLDFDEAVRKHPETVRKYFMERCVPLTDHKFAALHAAVFSGGTFIYVPKGVKVELPLQAYFRIDSEGMGQFEHTLIIAEEGAELHYIEGCSAPRYSQSNLHAGCVEIFVGKGAKVRYTSIENWSPNTYNLNTKRAVVENDGAIEWVNGNFGAGVTMLYPASVLKGKNSRSDFLGMAMAGNGQYQDTGTKVYHIGKNTASSIVSKAVVGGGGTVNYRGLVKISPAAAGSRSSASCDTLMFGKKAAAETIPSFDIGEPGAKVAHEASVGRIGAEQLFYLGSRGVEEKKASKLVVSGFFEPVSRLLPFEYAAELNRLIDLEMEGAVG